jgi:transcription antitermination factor NusG
MGEHPANRHVVCQPLAGRGPCGRVWNPSQGDQPHHQGWALPEFLISVAPAHLNRFRPASEDLSPVAVAKAFSMPILPLELDIYPESLLTPGEELLASSLADADRDNRWWVLYTLARQEKQLARRLLAREIPFYCPLIVQRTRSPAGRKRRSYVPLFPGYVFLKADDELRQAAMTTRCVSRCLPVADGPALARDLLQVRRLIHCGAPLTPEARLEPGAKVRVKSGLLEGLEGVVIRRHGEQRLLVSVAFLQRGASVLLDDDRIEPI